VRERFQVGCNEAGEPKRVREKDDLASTAVGLQSFGWRRLGGKIRFAVSRATIECTAPDCGLTSKLSATECRAFRWSDGLPKHIFPCFSTSGWAPPILWS